MDARESRLCKSCGIVKSFSEMTKNKNCRDGIASLCNSCKSDRLNKWRAEHRDHANEQARNYSKKYRKNNTEEYRLSRRIYYWKNREKILQKHKKNYPAKSCIVCNAVFNPKLSESRHCSEKCYNYWYSRHSWQIHKSKRLCEKINCLHCGLETIKKIKTQMFCSNSCRQNYAYSNLSAEEKREFHRRYYKGVTESITKARKKYQTRNRDIINEKTKKRQKYHIDNMTDKYILDLLTKRGVLPKATTEMIVPLIPLKRVELSIKRELKKNQ